MFASRIGASTPVRRVKRRRPRPGRVRDGNAVTVTSPTAPFAPRYRVVETNIWRMATLGHMRAAAGTEAQGPKVKRWTGWLVALLLGAKDLHDVALYSKRMAEYRAPASAPTRPTSACQEDHGTVEAVRSADDIPDGPVTITSDDGGLQCYSCKRRPAWPRLSGPTVNLPRDHVEGYGFGPFVCVDCRDAGLWEPINYRSPTGGTRARGW